MWNRTGLFIAGALLAAGLCRPALAEEAGRPAASGPDACTPLVVPAELTELRRRMLDPATTSVSTAFFSSPQAEAFRQAQADRAKSDWADLCHYRAANQRIASGAAPRPTVVFIGDSITENWILGDPDMFGPAVAGRGISGQTTPQILLRFRADVIDLHPRVAHIMAGTNDVAGNTGPTTDADIRNNIMSMVEIARANRVRVVLAAIPPAAAFAWAPQVRPAPRIRALNAWLRAYARREHLVFVDYGRVLATPEGGLKKAFSLDGVHPNRDGYAAMAPLTRAALARALRRR